MLTKWLKGTGRDMGEILARRHHGAAVPTLRRVAWVATISVRHAGADPRCQPGRRQSARREFVARLLRRPCHGVPHARRVVTQTSRTGILRGRAHHSAPAARRVLHRYRPGRWCLMEPPGELEVERQADP